MVPEGTPREALRLNATGGSTGEPVTFYQDDRYHDHGTAAEMLVQAWWNVGPGDRTAALWGADREFAEMSAKERFAQRLHRFRALNAFRLTEERMADVRRHARALAARVSWWATRGCSTSSPASSSRGA